MSDRLKTYLLYGALFGGCALIAAFLWNDKAKAADKGGPTFQEIVVPKASSHSGCGPALRAGWTIAAADFSPVTMSSEGGKVGVGAFCDWQFTKHFLVGAFVNYDWALGDLNTLGVQNDLTVGGRVGWLITNSVLAYLGGAYSRVSIEGADHVDGYKAILGFEMKLATEMPLFLSVEGSRGFYSDVMGSSLDVNSTEVIASLKYKFGAK